MLEALLAQVGLRKKQSEASAIAEDTLQALESCDDFTFDKERTSAGLTFTATHKNGLVITVFDLVLSGYSIQVGGLHIDGHLGERLIAAFFAARELKTTRHVRAKLDEIKESRADAQAG